LDDSTKLRIKQIDYSPRVSGFNIYHCFMVDPKAFPGRNIDFVGFRNESENRLTERLNKLIITQNIDILIIHGYQVFTYAGGYESKMIFEYLINKHPKTIFILKNKKHILEDLKKKHSYSAGRFGQTIKRELTDEAIRFNIELSEWIDQTFIGRDETDRLGIDQLDDLIGMC